MTETLRLPDAGARPQPESGAAAASAPVAEAIGNGEIEPTLYRFIMRHSWRDQLTQLAITGASLPFYYYSLDLPKTIVNKAISGKTFPQEFFGLHLEQLKYLMALCAMFLLMVFVNGGFKYWLNVLSGRTGERMLRRLRFELYHRLIRFPLGHFKRVSSAEIIPMVTAEVETLGGFIGTAITTPAFQGGQLLTLLGFMFVQDPVLGAAAVALYPLQGYVIPRLQRKVNQLGKQRVRTVRILADRVGESTAAIAEIRTNDAARWQLAQIAHILGTIYEIRFEVFQRKFFVKFLNNFINQLTPFFFFSIGGYLVITGSLSLGALVAVLAAYKDLASPWKELLDFYQQKEDSRIKYEQIIEQFQPDGMIPTRLQLGAPEQPVAFKGDLLVANLTLVEDERLRILDSVSFSLPLASRVAIVGQSGSGKHELGMLLARLIEPSNGRVNIGGVDLATLPISVIGRHIGYADQAPHIFATTIRDNLFYPLRSRPLRDPDHPPDIRKRRLAALEEARRSGNVALDIEADWIDYDRAGVKDQAELIHRTTEILSAVDVGEDVYHFGLRGRIDPKRESELAQDFLAARKALAQLLADEKLTRLVEPFDADKYNTNASMAENLLFGTPVGPAFEFDALATNSYVLQVLDKVGLRDDLVTMGAQVAETMIELFADLPPEHEFFEQFSFINAGDLPEYQAILGRISKSGGEGLKEEDRARLRALPFKLIAARHRLDLLDEAMQQRILEARRVFRADLPEALRRQIEFFDAASYNEAATLQDNILFGKTAYGEAEATERVPVLLSTVLESLGLRRAVMAVGLDFNCGTGGSRLALAQRQKIAIARALLKRPDLLILNEATSALDGTSQAKVMKAIEEMSAGRGLIWVLHRASLARSFDRVLVMSGGRLIEQGTPAELEASGTTFKILVGAE